MRSRDRRRRSGSLGPAGSEQSSPRSRTTSATAAEEVASNRVEVTNHAGAERQYGTGDDNRLTSDGVFAYLYDKESNRTARFVDDDESGTLNAGDTDVTQYEWDHRNRLVKVTERATHGGAITKQVDHAYDPLNRHVKRTVTAGSQVDQTFFLYDQGQIVLQFDGAGGGDLELDDLSHRYLWGPAVDMLLADEQVDWTDNGYGDGDVLWALSDHLGSVGHVVDSAGQERLRRQFDGYGNVVAETHFDASGEEVDSTEAGFVDVVFGYTGKFFDDVTGLQQNWHRWYDAAVGRWISQDPIGFAGGDANLSQYAGNRPTTSTDPTGHVEDTFCYFPPKLLGPPLQLNQWHLITIAVDVTNMPSDFDMALITQNMQNALNLANLPILIIMAGTTTNPNEDIDSIQWGFWKPDGFKTWYAHVVRFNDEPQVARVGIFRPLAHTPGQGKPTTLYAQECRLYQNDKGIGSDLASGFYANILLHELFFHGIQNVSGHPPDKRQTRLQDGSNPGGYLLRLEPIDIAAINDVYNGR